MQDNKTEWRKMAKFPDYLISDTKQIKSSLTNRSIPQRMDMFNKERGNKVMLHRGGWNTECFVDEMFLLAFPEKRAEVYGKKAA